VFEAIVTIGASSMKYDKLVRDRIPEIIKNTGATPSTHIASENEYWAKLCEKLLEESKELAETPNVDEVADVLEVLHAICEHQNLSLNAAETRREKKRLERGGFRDKIILDEVKNHSE
jgi:predicted house-cleaning noncanonical NTP pyrophosphatase (MazG superfamily)